MTNQTKKSLTLKTFLQIFMTMNFSFRLLLILVFYLNSSLYPEFVHHSDIVKKMKDAFKNISTYQASFKIKVKEQNDDKISNGKVYYKKPGKIHFNFEKPSGDLIISNGKKMWVYIKKINAVGIQNLDDNSSIYSSTTYEGLVSLFQRYHYRFKTPQQPQELNGHKYYVLLLEEKVNSGGFNSIDVYIDTKSYMIHKMTARTSVGNVVDLEFNSIKLNEDVSNNLFTYRIDGNVKVVENPLTME